ncbi:hypothetical protein CQ018_08680 [Arthrobacter sp. MYb227]|uniref:hypothetical protein n=1 Tax=Arthrobacter sp. MYb227 TaxID=1848601 RepID=UPI000CFB9FBE|nr:hypothetical protein [Arthrobacter sp. MYb227]PQZ93719.1 hypothetical protein CQ018_08680 [Arthrobacter sp. MYb227]
MEMAVSGLDGLIASAKLWSYDEPSEYLVKALKKMSGTEILGLHEELYARAIAASSRVGINEFVLPVYFARHPVPSVATALPAYYRRLNHCLAGLHAHTELTDEEPAYVEPLEHKADKDKDTLGSYIRKSQWLYLNGVLGQNFLDEDFPRAYEAVTSEPWSRHIRASGQMHSSRVLDYINPRCLGRSRVPEQVRLYWDAVDNMVSGLNESDQWWSWLRSGPWHRIELTLEKASPPESKTSAMGTSAGDSRIRGVRHTNTGSVLKIRVNLIESATRKLGIEDIRKNAQIDLQMVLEDCGKRHNFTAPVPRLPDCLESTTSV